MASQNPLQTPQFVSSSPPNLSPSDGVDRYTPQAPSLPPLCAVPAVPAVPALAGDPVVQQALSAEEAVVARNLADNRIISVVRDNTRQLDDLFRGHKDKTQGINTSFRELVEAKGVELETAVQNVVRQFLSNVRTSAAGGIDMARIEALCGEMQTNLLLQLGKHQDGMKELKYEDKRKLDKLAKDDTQKLVIIQYEGETALKGVIDGIFNKTQTFSTCRAEEAIRKIKRKPGKSTNKSRAGMGLDNTTNLAVQQPTHLQLALGSRIVPRRVASQPTTPTVGIFSRPASTNNLLTRPDLPPAPALPYTEDLVEIKKEDFYLDAEAEAALNEIPTKKRRLD